MVGIALAKEGGALSLLADDRYSAERKIDGERVKAFCDVEQIILKNRDDRSKTTKFVELVADLKQYRLKDTILDGEVAHFEGEKDCFPAVLSRSLTESSFTQMVLAKKIPLTYVVFDILRYNGEDMRMKPYSERRKVLEGIFKFTTEHIRLVEKVEGKEAKTEMWERMKANNFEGLILKDKQSLYPTTDINKRIDAWVKLKYRKEAKIRVVRYEPNPMGITVESAEGIRCQVAGIQHAELKRCIDLKGYEDIVVQYLTLTPDNKLFQPTYRTIWKEDMVGVEEYGVISK